MYIITGLGNPGEEYKNTRHNVGFAAVDYLANMLNVNLTKLKYNSVYGEKTINGEKVMLVKPLTYMNRSGICVSEIMNFYKVEIENLIVIYDDVDLQPGTLRIRNSGSPGTHNGMKSIKASLGNDNFPRIRIGIGQNRDMDLADYVLQKFKNDELDKINPIIENAAKAALEIVENGIDKAMQKYNIKSAY